MGRLLHMTLHMKTKEHGEELPHQSYKELKDSPLQKPGMALPLLLKEVLVAGMRYR